MDTEKILENKITLNKFITSCSETHALELLKVEIAGQCRRTFILRIYSRYNRLRGARERVEWLKTAKRV